MESILYLSTIAFKRKRTVEKAREETTTIGSIHISKNGEGRKMLEMQKREKMGEEARRGAGTGTLENRMECSKLFKASGRRLRRGRRIFVARAMASGIRLLNVFIAFERVRTTV